MVLRLFARRSLRERPIRRLALPSGADVLAAVFGPFALSDTNGRLCGNVFAFTKESRCLTRQADLPCNRAARAGVFNLQNGECNCDNTTLCRDFGVLGGSIRRGMRRRTFPPQRFLLRHAGRRAMRLQNDGRCAAVWLQRDGRSASGRRHSFARRANTRPVVRTVINPQGLGIQKAAHPLRSPFTGKRRRRASFVLFAAARMVSLRVFGNPCFAPSTLFSTADCAAYSPTETCRPDPGTFHGPRFSSPSEAGRRRSFSCLPLAVRSPDNRAERCGRGSPYIPGKRSSIHAFARSRNASRFMRWPPIIRLRSGTRLLPSSLPSPCGRLRLQLRVRVERLCRL